MFHDNNILLGGPLVATGICFLKTSIDGTRAMLYDALGRNVAVAASDASGVTNRIDSLEYDQSGNVVRRVTDFLDGRVAESTVEYDMLNREVRRTDAHGNESMTGYDPLDRMVSAGGDTYPLGFVYDSAGRKTFGSTTRDGGVTWDVTQWEYDAASGVNTAKQYADGSRIEYYYADNGNKTRTTWARGAWKENAYNARNLVAGTTYSDTATPSVAYTYADSGNTLSATGALADVLRFRFFTKYFDVETDLYYYGYRFYSPSLIRWLNRDPMEEDGSNNLYAFCGNAALAGVDVLGAVEYKGKSNTTGFFYEFVVGKCEIAIIYGHGHKTLPHKISFDDKKSSSAYFWGCWQDVTNNSIPKENRLIENVGRHNTMYDDEVFEQLKASREIAMRRATEICETECCKDGVWIRYQFSPSDEFGVRVLDWLKENTSRNKPSRLLMGGVWEGDTHVKCK